MNDQRFKIGPRKRCFCQNSPQKAKLLTIATICFAVASFIGVLTRLPYIACTYGGLALLYGVLARRARLSG